MLQKARQPYGVGHNNTAALGSYLMYVFGIIASQMVSCVSLATKSITQSGSGLLEERGKTPLSKKNLMPLDQGKTLLPPPPVRIIEK